MKKNTIYPITKAQESIWVAQKSYPGNYRFNAGVKIYLNKSVNIEKLESAALQLALEARLQRVKFYEVSGAVSQDVFFSPNETIQRRFFKDFQQAKYWVANEFKHPMDVMGEKPLFQQWIIETESGECLYFLKYHHLVLDGYGQSLVLRRLEEIYSEPDSPAIWSQDSDYFNAINNYEISAKHTRDLDFWKTKLDEVEQAGSLSERQSHFASTMLQERSSLGQSRLTKLTNTVSQASASVSQVLLALVFSYFHRMTDDKTVVLGIPVAARGTLETLQKPSMQSNEVPLVVDFSLVSSLADVVHQVKDELNQAIRHQQCRNEIIHREINRGGLDSKLTQTLVNIISFDRDFSFLGACDHLVQIATGPVADLTINIFIKDGEVSVLWDANPDNYTSSSLRLHAKRFLHFIDVCLESTRIDFSHEAWLLAEDTDNLEKFNHTVQPYQIKPLVQLIDEQAALKPQAIALQFSNIAISYADLKAQSDVIARSILAYGVTPGEAIGVYGLRSTEMVMAILAVQKTGCAYVPLDPELPPARILDQVEQANISTMLFWGEQPDIETTARLLDVTQIEQESFSNTLPQLDSKTPAYIIFTSGSTGRPKGVMVSHGAISNRILWMQEQYALDENDHVLQKTPFSFDVSVWEFFWPLAVGARLVVAEPGAHKDPRALKDILLQNKITTMHFVPSMLDIFLAEMKTFSFPSLKRIFCSGEALNPSSVWKTFESLPDVELHNLYGPTEAAVDVSFWQCSPEDSDRSYIPIGVPVANTQLWVLDSEQHILPPGMTGELYIGGAQLADGYVNQADLSAERFVEVQGIQGRLYRTGDLVVLRPDDGLIFLGRIDHQVKIRGLRIELGEIEAQLLQQPDVLQVAVAVNETESGSMQIVAYVVLGEKGILDTVEEGLSTKLPDYMVPTQWQVLSALPLLANGKVNRKALPGLVSNISSSMISEALFDGSSSQNRDKHSAQESLVLNVWQEVLARDFIALDAPFFSLGGDSMLAIRVRSLIEARGWTFNLSALFRNPTARQLAAQLVVHTFSEKVVVEPFDLVSSQDRPLLAEGLDDAFPLSAMQESMAYQAEIDQESSVYRVVTSLTIELPLDMTNLKKAIGQTFDRHPLLRSSFDLSRYSQPMQLVHKKVQLVIDEHDLSELPNDEQQAFIHEWVSKAKYHCFDLNLAPCLFFRTNRLSERRFQLSVVEHHVVLDGWSDLLMLGEIVENYSAVLEGNVQVRPALQSHYRDFIAAEQAIRQDSKAKQFWQSKLAEVDSAPLPRASKTKGTQHRSIFSDIPEALEDKLKALAKEKQLSIKSLLIASHLKVQSVLTGQQRVATGMVFNGRLHATDADKVIGVFLNTLPLGVSLGDESFIDIARQIAEFEADSLPYGRYPFTAMQKDFGQEIALDSYINYMDFHRDWGSENSLVSHAYGVANTNIPLAVNYLLDPVTHSLSLWFDCNEGELDEDLCERLPDFYITALEQIVATPDQPIFTQPIITKDESELISQWNHTDVEYLHDTCAYQMFEEVVLEYPARTALCFRDRTLSYEQLNNMANTMAQRMIDANVRPGDYVGVCVGRSPELMASLLAIHKVGAAYLPLDPSYPLERLNYIVGDAALNFVINTSKSPSLDVKTCIEWSDQNEVADRAPGNPSIEVNGTDSAYVIYTSGSSGRPKGTVISHRNLNNFLVGMDKTVGCNAGDSLLALTSVSFDISVLELFWPLARGAKVVIGSEKIINNLSLDPEQSYEALDFSFAPASCRQRNEAMIKQSEDFSSSWHEDNLSRVSDETNEKAHLSIGHSPVQKDRPIWLSPVAAKTTFEMAGRMGNNVLTHMLGQDITELSQNIKAYREAWKSAHHPGSGHVALTIHTVLLPDDNRAKGIAVGLFRDYLRTSEELLRKLTENMNVDFQEGVESEDLESILDKVVGRYFERSGLFGSPESVMPLLQQLHQAGVDEIASLVDFGVPEDQLTQGLSSLKQLQYEYQQEILNAPFSFAELMTQHKITIMQSTPSFMAAVTVDDQAFQSLSSLRAVLIGGEAFPVGLAQRLSEHLSARLFNMYGPTETTIWSSVHQIDNARIADGNRVSIGRPIANTKMRVLDTQGHFAPIGVPGELWIGGDGVCSGYLGRPELTSEKFQTLDGDEIKFYRTGDRVCWTANGELEFLGRIDRQIKVLGHRIEMDEIESVLSRHSHVINAAVIPVETGSGRVELIAYVEAQAVEADEFQADHLIDHWGQLWNNAYEQRSSYELESETDRDFAGWLSSYTGDPIPAEQMREWLNCTVTKIKAHLSEEVIDVGVGMGLIMRHVVEHCTFYTGIDLAPEALVVADQSIPAKYRTSKRRKLIEGDALILEQIPSQDKTLVVINSVAQYFPSQAYLGRVLNQALRVAGKSGAVFLGDVRSLEELETFHSSVQFFKAAPLATVLEIKQQISRYLDAEKELCLSLSYFVGLIEECADGIVVDMELKRGEASNEMNDFRYDVTLKQSGNKHAFTSPLAWSNRSVDEASFSDLLTLCNKQKDARIVIKNIPNHKLRRHHLLIKLLRQADDKLTKWDIEKQLWEHSEEGLLNPEEIAKRFESCGYEARLRLSAETGLRFFDLELTANVLTERKDNQALSFDAASVDVAQGNS